MTNPKIVFFVEVAIGNVEGGGQSILIMLTISLL